MKKLLLGSTALLGAIALSGAASAQQVVTRAPFTLQIGGAFNSYFAMNSGGDEGLASNKKNYDFTHESVLQFAASAKTDNGLTYGATIRKYFADASGNSQGPSGATDYDRSWVFVQGSFGRVDFGDMNSIRISNSVSLNAIGSSLGNGLGSDGGLAGYFYNVGGRAVGQFTALGNYPTYGNSAGSSTRRTKLAYQTPDFSGFTAGIAYIPSGNSAGNGFDRSDTISNTGRASYRDLIEIGARYEAKFSGVTVTPRLTYLTGSALKSNPTIGSLEDVSSVYAGVSVEYMGAGFGLGYTDSMKGGLLKNTAANTNPGQDSARGIVAQASYVTGPWAFSGYYQWATTEGSQANRSDDTMRLFELAGGYTLAPGLQLWTAVHNYEFKFDGATKYNGTLFFVGTTVNF